MDNPEKAFSSELYWKILKEKARRNLSVKEKILNACLDYITYSSNIDTIIKTPIYVANLANMTLGPELAKLINLESLNVEKEVHVTRLRNIIDLYSSVKEDEAKELIDKIEKMKAIDPKLS